MSAADTPTKHARGSAGSRAEAAAQALDVMPRLVHLLRQVAAGSDSRPLTLMQYRLLKRLADRVWLTSELAADLDVTAATVSAAIDCLVRRGLVERHERSGDRRAVPLSATADGRAAVRAARRRQLDALASLLDALTPEERAGLALGLSGLAAAMSARQIR